MSSGLVKSDTLLEIGELIILEVRGSLKEFLESARLGEIVDSCLELLLSVIGGDLGEQVKMQMGIHDYIGKEGH